MSEQPPTTPTTLATTSRGFGRALVFVYGIFAFSATGRSSYQLATKASEAPLAYSLSALAAVVYIVATWALGTGRHPIAVGAVVVELLGVIVIGATIHPSDPAKATVWSGFGSGYGYVPLVLPFVGLWWLWRTRPTA
ncbi:MAG TPA: hypothetical protein VFE15_14595 [Marmoricola sp.]|jgi:hypothetical protein|nr:hypothetical protein [Marmoricola sp.]